MMAEVKPYTDLNTDLKYEYDTEAHTATLIDGKRVNKTKVDFILSSFEVDSKTYYVKTIGEEAFTTKDNNKYEGPNIEYVVIPDGIETIGENAFKNCTKLKLLELPSSISSVATNAFDGCSQLTYVYCKSEDASIDIPTSLPQNELMSLFVPVSSLHTGDKGYLNTSYSWVDDDRFGDRIYGGKMEIVSSTTESMSYVCATGESASKKAILIDGNRAAEVIVKSSILGDDNVTYEVVGIGRHAFYGFSELSTLRINEGITYISTGAFQNCSNLQQIEFPSSLKAIGLSAFQNCKGLKLLTLSSGLTSIKNDAFKDCSNLAEIVSNISGSNIYSIPSAAFPDKDIILYIPSGAKEQYDNQGWNTSNFLYVFEGARKTESNNDNSLTYVYTESATKAILLNSDAGNTTVEIDQAISGKEVTAIAKCAFINNSELTRVTIPDKIRSIGKYALYGCNKLAEIVSNIDGNNIFALPTAAFSDKNIILYIPSGSKDVYDTNGWNTSSFLHVFEGERKTEPNNDNTLTYVYTDSDNEAVLLKSNPVNTEVEIGQTINNRTVTAIARSAFNGNSELIGITIPEGMKSIGSYAFKGCAKLKEVKLPQSLTSIGDYAFNGITFDNVIIKVQQPIIIESNVFSSYSSSLYVPVGARNAYNLNAVWKKFAFIYEGEKGETTIGETGLSYAYATGDQTAVLISSVPTTTKVTIPSKIFVDGIGDCNVIGIEKSALISNSEIEELEIQANVKTIGANAFKSCTKLKKVELPSTLTSIGDNAFKDCSDLTDVTFNGNPTTLTFGNGSFQNCTSLKLFSFPAGLTSIGNNAFNGCGNLTEIVSNINDDNIFPFPSTNAFPDNNVILYITSGTREQYATQGWDSSKFLHIFQGARVENTDDEKKLTYVYTASDNEAVLLKSDPENTTAVIEQPSFEKTVIAIAKSAFINSVELTEITIPDGVKTISKNAFKGCSKLKKVELPSTLTSIGDNAFNGSTLEYVITKANDPINISSNVFSSYKGSLYVPGGHLDSYKGNDVWKKFASIYEGEMKEKSFDDTGLSYVCATAEKTAVLISSASSTKKVVIPSKISVDGENDYTVIGIKESAMTSNSSVEELEIQENIKNIGANAFKGCSKLKKVELPSTLTSIGDNAFNGSTLDYVVIKAQTPVNIKSNVFSSYKGSLYVPENSSSLYNAENCVWNQFAFIYEGEMKVKAPDDTGLSYVCATAEKTAVLITSVPTTKKVVIPSKISVDGENDYTVIGIKESAMISNSSVEELEIQENIKTIGANAFKGCSKLKRVELPSTLTSIGDNAFNGSTLDYVVIKAQAPININSNVFSSYKGSLYVPENSSSLYNAENCVWNQFAFIYEGEMKEKSFDDTGLSYVCATAEKTAVLITSASSTKKVTIPSKISVDGENDYTVIGIKESAMISNSSVEELEIQENSCTIGANAFKGCSKLKKVVLPSTLTSIGDNAFNGSTLEYVVIKAQNPININSNVFSSYKGTLYVPENSRSLYNAENCVWNQFAFIYEGEMKEKTFDDTGLSYVCATAEKTAVLITSASSTKKVTIPSKISVDGENDYTVIGIKESAMISNSSVEELEIQENSCTIGANAFKGCSKLKKVVLPSTLTSIGDNAFNGSTLDYVVIKAQNPININSNVFSSYKGTLYVPENSRSLYQANEVWNKFASIYEGEMKEKSFDDTGLSYVCATAEKTAVLISSASSTKKVVIPSKISVDSENDYTVIGVKESAMASNSSVEELEIQENVKIIGDNAFKGCSKLKKVMLPASLDSIGNNAFEKCSSLVLVTCAGEKPAIIKENTFPSNEIIILVPNGKVSLYQNETNWWRKYTIVDTMSSVSYDDDPDEAKPGIYVVTTSEETGSTPTVALVNDIKISGEYIIPQIVTIGGVDHTVTAIASGAFENNTGLTNILIPSTIETIGESAFAGCTNLKSITVNRIDPIDLSSPSGIRGIMTRASGRSVFDGVDKATCILYVPDVSLEKYRNAAVWSDFENILTFKTTSINGIVADEQQFDVYNLQGRKVKSNVGTLNDLPAGIYIVKGKKVVVR